MERKPGCSRSDFASSGVVSAMSLCLLDNTVNVEPRCSYLLWLRTQHTRYYWSLKGTAETALAGPSDRW